MKTRLAVLFGFVCILPIGIACPQAPKPELSPSPNSPSCSLNKQSANKALKFNESVATVHIYTPATNSEEMCMAFAFSKNEGRHQFLTAAHCVANYVEETRKTILKDVLLHLVLERKNNNKLVIQVKVLAVGEMKDFEEFAVLETTEIIYEDIPLMPLSKFDPELDEDVRVVSTPLGHQIGLLYFRGYVSREKVDGMTMPNGAKVAGTFFVQFIGLGTAQGTSGGGVLSVKHEGIMGLVIGSAYNGQGHASIVVAKISKFNYFYKEFLEGKRLLSEHEKVELEKEEAEPKKEK